jgi:hypothetical protein
MDEVDYLGGVSQSLPPRDTSVSPVGTVVTENRPDLDACEGRSAVAEPRWGQVASSRAA